MKNRPVSCGPGRETPKPGVMATLAALILLTQTSAGCLVYDVTRCDPESISRTQVKELENALQLFRYDTGRYPTTSEGLRALFENPGGVATWKGPYLRGPLKSKDVLGRPFRYRCPGRRGDYDLWVSKRGE